VRAAVRVLDSYSLISYFEGEAGADAMIEIFRAARDSGRLLLLSVVNWGEVFYITLREAGRERAEMECLFILYSFFMVLPRLFHEALPIILLV